MMVSDYFKMWTSQQIVKILIEIEQVKIFESPEWKTAKVLLPFQQRL